MIKNKGCKIYYTESGKYEKYVSAGDLLQNNISNMIAENDSIQISSTVSRVMLDMSERGTLIKKAAYGEKKVKDSKKGTPHVHNDDEWKGVCRMFEMKQEDPSVSYRRMCKLLDNEGIKTKTGKGGWYSSAVKKILEVNKDKYEKWKRKVPIEENKEVDDIEQQIKQLQLKKEKLAQNTEKV